MYDRIYNIITLCIGGAVWYSGVCEQVETAKVSRVSNDFSMHAPCVPDSLIFLSQSFLLKFVMLAVQADVHMCTDVYSTILYDFFAVLVMVYCST